MIWKREEMNSEFEFNSVLLELWDDVIKELEIVILTIWA
jgi:hypothetical protein